jgi:phosphatidylethanolamine-binding protein (PEBP) family uncharacterized protein
MVLLYTFPTYAADTLYEFHNTLLDHYFMTIDPAEAAAIDAGAAGPGWQRTGKTIAAYRLAASAPAGAAAVCRFYGNQAQGGPNGHFYTADPAECAAVKLDPGWTFERNEFYTQLPANGACPAGSPAVYRVYNGRYAQHDSNHRYTTAVATYNQMIAAGWLAEGVVFCAAAGTASSGSMTLASTAAAAGGTLPADYTCDGTGSTLPLSWSNAPSGTTEFALLMTTLPGDGTVKYNWVLHGIPAVRAGLAKDAYGVGAAGIASDGPFIGYQPPCSEGPGAKVYTWTLYALSAAPVLPAAANQVTGAVLADAIAGITLDSASLSLSYARTTPTGSSAGCLYVRNSTAASTTGLASVSCDAHYAYVGSNGIASHAMMNGITATNLQVPVAQNFLGARGWKIPLNPAIAPATTTAVDGPIGIAINGVPIFNPCKQGGCQNGDTKVLGELDVCNGHAGRADDYHYHAAPTCMMAGKPASYWDTHPLGWALDGFAIFGYNNPDGTVAARDGICGGNTVAVQNAPSGYSYHVTDASPYVLACFAGTPSPDLAGQGAKYSPMRQPPVTPFPVSEMTLSTDPADGYQVLQFTSARSFTTTETGSDSYNNAPGTYRIRYKAVTGTALEALLAQNQNANKSACWNFQFVTGTGATAQPTITYCR